MLILNFFYSCFLSIPSIFYLYPDLCKSICQFVLSFILYIASCVYKYFCLVKCLDF